MAFMIHLRLTPTFRDPGGWHTTTLTMIVPVAAHNPGFQRGDHSAVNASEISILTFPLISAVSLTSFTLRRSLTIQSGFVALN